MRKNCHSEHICHFKHTCHSKGRAKVGEASQFASMTNILQPLSSLKDIADPVKLSVSITLEILRVKTNLGSQCVIFSLLQKQKSKDTVFQEEPTSRYTGLTTNVG